MVFAPATLRGTRIRRVALSIALVGPRVTGARLSIVLVRPARYGPASVDRVGPASTLRRRVCRSRWFGQHVTAARLSIALVSRSVMAPDLSMTLVSRSVMTPGLSIPLVSAEGHGPRPVKPVGQPER